MDFQLFAERSIHKNFHWKIVWKIIDFIGNRKRTSANNSPNITKPFHQIRFQIILIMSQNKIDIKIPQLITCAVPISKLTCLKSKWYLHKQFFLFFKFLTVISSNSKKILKKKHLKFIIATPRYVKLFYFYVYFIILFNDFYFKFQ
jgi:hypothetical protein